VVAWTDVSLLAERLLLLLMTGVLLSLGNGPSTFFRAALAGLSTGLSALVRPTALVLLPLVLVTLAIQHWGRRSPERSWRRAACPKP
jgi:4-amino-4-deoxy-L-arabinose transferase-like glycosyltransferase